MDKAGFNQLINSLRPKMYRFALAFIGRTDEADDVVQDVGVKLWERREELGSLHSVEAYAMRAVKNRCLDYVRSPHRKTDELAENIHLPHEQTPHKSLEQADMAAFVRKRIEQLPVQQQMIIRLRDIEGYELEEIAVMLEMNEGAVRTGLSRARQKMREELIKQMNV